MKYHNADNRIRDIPNRTCYLICFIFDLFLKNITRLSL